MKRVLVALIVTLAGCSPSGPRTIVFGADECAQCRMAITDRRFGAELVMVTGKPVMFDAVECMLDFRGAYGAARVASIWVIDFASPGTFIDGKTAFYIQLPAGHSPMGRGLIATRDEATASALQKQMGGSIKRWNEL